MQRSSGILLHIAALPCKYGIGGLGRSSYEFADFLSDAGQKYWQVLPLVPTGYGDSPYQSSCSSAGNEYFIDLDILAEKGLLTTEELAPHITAPSCRIDYERLFRERFSLLRKAFDRFDKSDKKFTAFVKSGEYADYALFCALKQFHEFRSWNEWDDAYKFRNADALAAFSVAHADEIMFRQWCQFEFDSQWRSLKTYANDKGIKIIGDMPIYIAYDSVECWTRPDMVKLDNDMRPTVVAGCPPDAFSVTGQLWGNPIYDWNRIASDGFDWWKERLKKCFSLFDVVRIDHFRGFDRYCEIPFGDPTAERGQWVDGPSAPMFAELERGLGKMEVIAEDLGILDDSARRMFAEVGYPGMKVLQFAFDSGETNEYLPHNYTSENCVAYTGTHDNDTLLGFVNKLGQNRDRVLYTLRRELEYTDLPLPTDTDEQICDAIIELCFKSKAVCSIIPLQDWLKIGGEGRINMPSTLSTDNWSYRIPDFGGNDLAAHIRNLTEKYGR